jgi:hypothetical protein
MPIPGLGLDEALQQFAHGFRELLSKPQYQSFVTVLLGLMLCEGARTLRGLLEKHYAKRHKSLSWPSLVQDSKLLRLLELESCFCR